MTEWIKNGEACDHPGCLSHVTHPCEGCGRVAGRGRPWNEERRWAQEYCASFFEESSVKRQTRELAEHYHDVVDEFDLALCPRTAGFPTNSEERRASMENARRTKEELYRCVAPLGVSPQTWTDEIRRAAQRTRGRCRD